MKSIRLDEVSRAYGRNFALHRVSFDLDPGSTTVLLGANGAGKTTLLNILATLDAPSNGRILFGDIEWGAFSARGRRNIGWVSHDSLVYEDLTGLENLRFYARMYNVDESEIGPWLDRVGLSDAGDKIVRAYSRGMKQRLSIARALLHRPALVLLDEPLTGLDRDGREDMLDLFARERDRGCILVMITHDLDLPDGFVDNLAILRAGKLAFFGPLSDGADILERFREHA